LNAEQSVRQKRETQSDQGYTPGDRISVKLSRDRIFLGVGSQAGAHQLRGTARINRCK
jgi:hypothetical protein